MIDIPERFNLTDHNTKESTVCRAASQRMKYLLSVFKTYIKTTVGDDWYVVAGSYLPSLIREIYTGDKDTYTPNDIDIFLLKDKYHILDQFIESLKLTFECIKTSKADYAFVGGVTGPKLQKVYTFKLMDGRKVQFIFTDYERKEDLLNDIDFLHCRIHFHNNKLYITEKILDACLNKKLIMGPNFKLKVNKTRVLKYISRNFTVDASLL